MKTDKFSDRTDVTTTIALYEYGIIRNPNNDKCIVCTNCYELNANFGSIDNGAKPIIKTMFISFEDVKEALEETELGYYSFIGSDKETELNNLDNEYLTYHIFSLNMYNGYFDLNSN